jgi:hypothetical protein
MSARNTLRSLGPQCYRQLKTTDLTNGSGGPKSTMEAKVAKVLTGRPAGAGTERQSVASFPAALQLQQLRLPHKLLLLAVVRARRSANMPE